VISGDSVWSHSPPLPFKSQPHERPRAPKTRSSLGPDGLNKMVINHLGKLFVTHDAATILPRPPPALHSLTH